MCYERTVVVVVGILRAKGLGGDGERRWGYEAKSRLTRSKDGKEPLRNPATS